MYNKPTLDLAQTQAAMAAMLAEGAKIPDQPVAIAIVDDAGDIVSYAVMDNTRKFSQRIAINKAYTSALFGRDSQALADMLKSQEWSIADFADPKLSIAPGGVAMVQPSDGEILGGIGVSGRSTGEADGDICRIGLKAMGL